MSKESKHTMGKKWVIGMGFLLLIICLLLAYVWFFYRTDVPHVRRLATIDDLKNYDFSKGELGFSILDDDGKPKVVMKEDGERYEQIIYYKNGTKALERRNGCGKAYWSNGELFTEWSEDSLGKPINGVAAQFQISNEGFNGFKFVLNEYQEGQRVKEFLDPALFGGTPELVKEFEEAGW